MNEILVTGADGFLAGWIMRGALRRGLSVRAPVHTEEQAENVRRMLTSEGLGLDRCSFPLVPIPREADWVEAMRGADAVVHSASTFQGGAVPLDEFSEGLGAPEGPARAGEPDAETPRETSRFFDASVEAALVVVRAAVQAGVPRVVLTSSAAAALPHGGRGELDEGHWSDPDSVFARQTARARSGEERAMWRLGTAYLASKVRLEREAQAICAAGPATGLASILPGLILGPAVGGRTPLAAPLFDAALRGIPAPRLELPVVDVRDLAELHLLAIERAAAGERFLGVSEVASAPAMARLLRRRLGRRGRRIRPFAAPAPLVRAAGRVNPVFAVIAGLGEVRCRYRAAKARRLLGWRPRSLECSLVDTAAYLLDNELL
ncbi:MAG: NAD(P)H-binding protein [Pseudoclavibacter sp.]|nr:NAD(P)H-binding protein [Pseudoclavibacter sp.]